MFNESILKNAKEVAFIGKGIITEDKAVVYVLKKRSAGDTFTLMEYIDGKDILVMLEYNITPDRGVIIFENLSVSERFIYMKGETMKFDLPSDEIKERVYMDYKHIMHGLKEINRVLSRDDYVIECINNAEDPVVTDNVDDKETITIELPTAAKSFEDGGANEMEKYIKRINRAIDDGKREAYLINGASWLPRKEHVEYLVNAGYDINIEKIAGKYHVVANWDSAKESGGKIMYSVFGGANEPEEVSLDFFEKK
jgi:hypothetical protein